MTTINFNAVASYNEDELPVEHQDESASQKKEDFLKSVENTLAAQLQDVATHDDVSDVSGDIQIKVEQALDSLYAKFNECLRDSRQPAENAFTRDDLKSALAEAFLNAKPSLVSEVAELFQTTNKSLASLKQEVQDKTSAQEMIDKAVAALRQEIQTAGLEVRENIQNSVQDADNSEVKDAIKKLRRDIIQMLVGVSLAMSAVFFGALAFWRI
jgi:chromosome segregation ATPase